MLKVLLGKAKSLYGMYEVYVEFRPPGFAGLLLGCTIPLWQACVRLV